MKKNLNPKPLAISLAIWSATFMLLLGVSVNLGFYTKAAEAMMNWHMFFSLDLVGIFTRMIEAAVFSALGVYLFVFIYNAVV